MIGRAVVVTTEQRGTFFGYTAEDGRTGQIKLFRARHAFYWRCGQGVFGLAATGPEAGSKVGPRADVLLTGVTAVIEVADAAVEQWEAAKWA